MTDKKKHRRRKSHHKKQTTCLCDNAEECQGLTAAFSTLRDARCNFVSLPQSSSSFRERQRREAYLQCLSTNQHTPSSNHVALHHFPPHSVKHVSRTYSKEEIADLEAEEFSQEFVDKHGQPTGDYFVLPNYPARTARKDLMVLIQDILAKRKAKRKRRKSTDDEAMDMTVRFSTVSVREYPIIPGDNPGGNNGGPPLTMDWTFVEEYELSVKEFEVQQAPSRVTAKDMQALSGEERLKKLQRLGFSQTDIQNYTQRANVVRNNRKETVDQRRSSEIHELKEKIQRAVLNVTFRRKQKKKEREFLKQNVEDHSEASTEPIVWDGEI